MIYIMYMHSYMNWNIQLTTANIEYLQYWGTLNIDEEYLDFEVIGNHTSFTLVSAGQAAFTNKQLSTLASYTHLYK